MYSFMERYRIVSNTHMVFSFICTSINNVALRTAIYVNAIGLSCSYTGILNIKFWQTYILALFASTKLIANIAKIKCFTVLNTLYNYLTHFRPQLDT